MIGVAPYVRDVLGDVQLREFALESETGIPELPDEVARDPAGEAVQAPLRRPASSARKVLETSSARSPRLDDLDVAVDMVGQGNDLDTCRAEAVRLGVTERITFHGGASARAGRRVLRGRERIRFPSFREPSGNVVLEAMSWGLPLMVADRRRPAVRGERRDGHRVPVETPEQFCRDIANAIRRLVAEPGLAPPRRRREAAHRARSPLAREDRTNPRKYERVVAGRYAVPLGEVSERPKERDWKSRTW